MKMSSGPKRKRSTKAPIISAGVMMAKVIWNMKKTVSGMVVPAAIASRGTPSRSALSRLPIQSPAPLKARLYAPASHSTEARQAMMKECISTESRFSARTSPP